jgi:lysophospholipid acyltransferase (LPLAT)-like uncharacterized protein
MIRKMLPIMATLVAMTLRFRWISKRPTSPCVIMFWHGKMIAGWYAARALDPVALVSKSKDGELLTSVLKHWHYTLVRGSSKKNGRQALEEAIEAIRLHNASALAITPDGPRGPRMKYKRGAFIAAQELACPLYHLNVEYSSPVRLIKSWDKFEIPLPFSRVTLRAIPIDYGSYPTDVDAQRVWLDELAERIETHPS